MTGKQEKEVAVLQLRLTSGHMEHGIHLSGNHRQRIVITGREGCRETATIHKELPMYDETVQQASFVWMWAQARYET